MSIIDPFEIDIISINTYKLLKTSCPYIKNKHKCCKKLYVPIIF